MAITEREFKKFIASLPDCEVLDESRIPGQKRADFLLHRRTFVADLKCLERDTLWKLQEFIDNLSEERGIRFYRELPFDQIVNAQPDRDRLNARAVFAVSTSLEQHFREANKQIVHTVRDLRLVDSLGVVILINNSNTPLVPELAQWAVSNLLLKKTQRGESRFPSIHGCLYLSEIHDLPDHGAKDLRVRPALKIVVSGGQPYDSLGTYLDKLLENWTRYVGVRLINGVL